MVSATEHAAWETEAQDLEIQPTPKSYNHRTDSGKSCSLLTSSFPHQITHHLG